MMALTGCLGLDPRQVETCREVLAILLPEVPAPDTAAATRLDAATLGRLAGAAVESAAGVRLDWPAPDGGGRLACVFAGGMFSTDRLALVHVEVDGRALSDMQRFWLARLLDQQVEFEPRLASPGHTPPGLAWLVALQQAINATSVACVYALTAIGFTLIYGLIGRINFAFGETVMIGGMAAALWPMVFAGLGLVDAVVSLALVLAITVPTAAAVGWASHRLVFRPLASSDTTAPLIAALGLALFLQEGVRLLQGAGNLWRAPAFDRLWVLAGGGSFPVTVVDSQILVVAVTLAVFVAVWLLVDRSRFGRRIRATADDAGMAALLGVDTQRVVAGAFALAGALAGLAGVLLVVRYGVVNFYIGVMIAFKSLTAAILGGIGSIRGAMAGGLLLGLVETAWSATAGPQSRDVVVFALLALVLIFRPEGLFGVPQRPTPG